MSGRRRGVHFPVKILRTGRGGIGTERQRIAIVRTSIPFAHSLSWGCVEFNELSNSLWLGTEAGEIISLRLLDRRVTVLGSGYLEPVAVMPAVDGLGVFIAERAGLVMSALRGSAGRAHAAVIADLARPLAGARLSADGASAVVMEAGTPARLLRVDLSTGADQVLAEGLTDPVAFVIDAADTRAIVLDRPAAGARVVAVDLASGDIDPRADAPGATALVDAPPTVAPAVVTASELAGNLALLGLAGQPAVAGPSVGAVRGLARWTSLILAVTGASIEAVEWGLDEGSLPLSLPLGPAWIHGYLCGEFDPAAVGLAAVDVGLEVEEGITAGSVSAGVEPPGPSGACRFRLLTGVEPGEFHLNAIRKSDGARIGRARFRVIHHWPDEQTGPPIALPGRFQILSWGGGPPGAQNIRIHPAPEAWRLAVVFVSTLDLGLPEDLSASRNEWRRRIDGDANSLRRYYEEVSYRNTPQGATGPLGTTMEAVSRDFAPLDLQGGWGDYFEPRDRSPGGLWRGWDLKDNGFGMVAEFSFTIMYDPTAESLLNEIDAFVFVVQTASDEVVTVGDSTLPAKFVWPVETDGSFFFWPAGGSFFSGLKSVSKPVVFMPTEFPAGTPPDRRFDLTTTLWHEIGHTLGCEDLSDPESNYPPEVNARFINKLDLMGLAQSGAHFSLPNRMRLGWIDPGWIRTFDFGADPNGGSVTLHCAGLLNRSGPPPGRYAGIEVRLRDGWNYYFEFRKKRFIQVGDQNLHQVSARNRLVAGTDVSADGIGDVARPRILLLPDGADGAGPILDGPNEKYEESDVTNPERMHDFRVVFKQLTSDDNGVELAVEYVDANRAELQIRPAPGRGNWKSPDIDLEGPAGPNVIAKGLFHTVVVRVRNAGTFDAEDVRVRVAWLPFTTSPGEPAWLDDPPRQNVPRGATIEFRTSWSVPAALQLGNIEVNHFCVKAKIDRYVDPREPSHSEIVVANNEAQSNFNSTAVGHGSPSDRRVTGVSITNPLPRRATYLTRVQQDSPNFRAYLGSAWLRLEPGETRMIDFAYESLAGDPVYGDAFKTAFEQSEQLPPSLMAVMSWLVPSGETFCPTPHIVWGVNLIVQAGYRTRFRDVRFLGEVVRGHVEAEINDAFQPVTGGRVYVVLWSAERPDRQFLCSADVRAGGRFEALTPPEIQAAFSHHIAIIGDALYLGLWRWAPCRRGIRANGLSVEGRAPAPKLAGACGQSTSRPARSVPAVAPSHSSPAPSLFPPPLAGEGREGASGGG